MFTKIGLKLILAVGLVTVIIIGIYSYFSIQSQAELFLSTAESHANKLSDTIKRSTHSSMLLNRSDETHQIINTIGEEPQIHEIRIFNKDGIIIYSTREDLIGTMVDKKAESCYACHTANEPLEK